MKILKIEEICFSPSLGRMRCAVLAAPFELGAAIYQGNKNEKAANTQANAQLIANREQIAAQKAENDMAFIRNNSLGQLSQLMAAGLSEQQARQVIAGAGSTGTYEPAQIRSEMEGVDLGAAIRARGDMGAQALSITGDTIAKTGQEVLQALTLATGGPLGAAVAAPFMSDITPHMDLIDRSKVHSAADFKIWTKGLDPNSQAGKVFRPMLESKNWKRIEHFSPAMKSFTSTFNDVYTSALDSNQQFELNNRNIALTYADESLKNALTYQAQAQTRVYDAETGLITQQYQTEIQRTKLTQQQVLGTKYDQLMKKLQYERDIELFDVITDAQKQQYIVQAQNAINECKLKSDPVYIENWLKAQSSSVQGEYFLNLLNACNNRMSYNLMANDPQLHYITSIYSALTQSGMNTGIIGQIMQASGFTTFELDSRLENVPESIINMPSLN